MAGHSIPGVEALLGVGDIAVAVAGSMRLGVVGVGIAVVDGMVEGGRMSSRLNQRRILPGEDRMEVGPKRGVSQSLEGEEKAQEHTSLGLSYDATWPWLPG